MESAELMLSYCQGNDASFEALYKQVAPRLGGYLRRLMRNGSDAEDVLQQTFVKLHLARDSYIPGADPIPWIYVIAHRACLDELRVRRRAQTRLGSSEAQLEPTANFSGQPGWETPHGACEQEDWERVLAALECLTDDQRTTLVLTQIQGKTLAQAASAQGISVGAVKLRTHRARRRLQAILAADESRRSST